MKKLITILALFMIGTNIWAQELRCVGNIWYNNYAKVSYVLRKQSKVSDY